MGADDGGHASVEVPAHRHLLRGRLGVHVDEDVIDRAELSERGLDLGERRAAGPQVEVAAHVDDAERDAVALDHAGAVTGLAAQEVGGPHDPRLGVQIRVDLTAVIGVVPERDRVDARGEHLVGDLRRDAEAAGGVLAVDDDERGGVALAQDAAGSRAACGGRCRRQRRRRTGRSRRPAASRPTPAPQPYSGDGGRPVTEASGSAPRAAPPGPGGAGAHRLHARRSRPSRRVSSFRAGCSSSRCR